MTREVVHPSGVRTTIPGQAETAVTRVTAYLAARRHYGREGTIALEIRRGGRRFIRHPLTDTDLEALVAIVHELCPDTQRCIHCGAIACETCGVGQLTDCDPPHCAHPECWCGECRDDEARERQAEIRADIDLERCE